MIVGKIEADTAIVVPDEIRVALGIKAGDDVVWELDGGSAVLTRVGKTGDMRSLAGDGFVNNFTVFTEWSSEADCRAFDDL